MGRNRARNLSLIVLGGGLLLGLVVGLALFLLLSQWIGSRSIAPATGTPALSPSVVPQPSRTPMSEPVVEETLEPSPLQGSPAPDFELESLEGELISLSDYHGSIVLINFWATWCPPCRAEMPMFQDRYEHYADQGFEILAVNYDAGLREVLTFRHEHDLSFPILIDSARSVQNAYRIWSFPTSFIVDREGIIRYVHLGPMMEVVLDQYLLGAGIDS